MLRTMYMHRHHYFIDEFILKKNINDLGTLYHTMQ